MKNLDELLDSSALGSLPYHPLWHLIAINWAEGFIKTIPKEPIPTRVCLIDLGVHIGHPYLATAIDASLAIDFSANPSGLGYVAGKKKTIAFDPATLDRLSLPTEEKRTIRALIDKVNGRPLPAPMQSALHTAFPGHGTACAGLIGARMPGLFADPLPPLPDGRPAAAIPYLGVDPLCTIVPISTSLNPTPGQLILALLYAYEKDVDVIHMPRGVSVAWTNDDGGYDNPGNSLKPDDDKAEWEAFETLLFAVSGAIPVVCAAGNSGESRLAYPASLSLEDKGDNGIVSVGGITAEGYRSSYSNYGEGLCVAAPSDDASAFNENQIRVNEAGRRFQIHDYGGYIAGGLPRVELSRRALLTTDIPGQAGYTGYAPLGYDQDDDAFAYAYDPLQGAFTLFGGTSGASSIVAGLTALMTRRAKMSGKQLQRIAIQGHPDRHLQEQGRNSEARQHQRPEPGPGHARPFRRRTGRRRSRDRGGRLA